MIFKNIIDEQIINNNRNIVKKNICSFPLKKIVHSLHQKIINSVKKNSSSMNKIANHVNVNVPNKM